MNKYILFIILVFLFFNNSYANIITKEFSVSKQYGFVSESHIRSNNNNIIIIIQDLHNDISTQLNIKNVVAEIDKNYGYDKILIEGLYNKPYWMEENTSNMVDVLFKNLYLSGAEYYAILNNKLNKVLPLDDKILYTTNIQRLAYLTLLENDVYKTILKYDKIINSAKNKIYSSKNQKIDKIINKHNNGKISQEKFYLLLQKYTNKEHIDKFPNISKYYKLIRNNNINYTKFSKELDLFKQELQTSIPYVEYHLIISNSNFLNSKLENLCTTYNIDLNKYNELNKYISLNKIANQIDYFAFIDEERDFLRDLKIKYSKNRNERLLVVLDDLYSYYKDLLTNRITEYGYNYLNNFGIDNFMNLWVNVLSDKNIYELKEYHKYFNEYNKTNIYRSEIFVDKILKIKQNIGRNVIAVMGGFHTKQVAEYLKYKNASYVVITPTFNGLVGKKQNYLYKQNILRTVDLQYNAIPAPSVLNDKKEQKKAIHYCLDTKEETDYDKSALKQGIMASQWISSLNIHGDKNIKITSVPGLIASAVINGELKRKLQSYLSIFNSRHSDIIQVSDEASLHLTIYNPTAKKPQKVSDITGIFKNKDFVKKIATALGISEENIENNDTILTDEDKEVIYNIIELEIKHVLNSFYKKGFKFPKWEIDGLAAFPNGIDTQKTILVFHARPKTYEDFIILSKIQQALYDKLGFKDYPIFNGHITLGRFTSNDFSSEEEKKEFLKTVKEIDNDIKSNLTKPKYTLHIRPIISRLHLKDSKTEKHKSKTKISNPIYFFINILRNDLINLFDRIKMLLSQKFPTLFDNEQKMLDIDSKQIKDMLEQLSPFYRNNNFEENIKTEMATNLINELNEQARQSSNYLEAIEKIVNEKNKEFSSTYQGFKLQLFKSNNTIKIIVVDEKDPTGRHNISEVFTFSGEKFEEQSLEEKLDIYDNMTKENFISKFKISEQEYEKVKDIIKSKNITKIVSFLQKINNINTTYYIFFHFNNNLKFIERIVNNEYIDIKIRLYAYIIARIYDINISTKTEEILLKDTLLLIKNEMVVRQTEENIQNFYSLLENELFRNEIFVSYHAAIILYLQSAFPEKQISKETFTKLLGAGINKTYNGSGDARFIYGEEHIWNNKRFANISAHEIGHNFLYDLHIDTRKIDVGNIRKFVGVIHEFYAQNTAHIFMNGNGFGNGQILCCIPHFHGLTKQYESSNRYDGNYQYNFNNRSPHLGGYSLLYMLNDLLNLSDNKNAINLSIAIENITLKYINKIQNADKYIVYDYIIELLEEYGKIAGYDVSNTIKYLQDNRSSTNYDDVWLFPKLDKIPKQHKPISTKNNFNTAYTEANQESLYQPITFEIVNFDSVDNDMYISILSAS